MAIEALRRTLLENYPSSLPDTEVFERETPTCTGSELRQLADDLRNASDYWKGGGYKDNALQMGRWCGQMALYISGQDHAYLRGVESLIYGNTENHWGHYETAYAALTEASQYFRAAHSDVMWARTQIGRMWAAKETGQLDTLQADLREAEQTLIAAGPTQQEFLFRLYSGQAAIAGANKRYDEQYDLLCRILLRVDRDANPLRVATTFDSLAMHYVAIGKDMAAIDCLHWAITLAKEHDLPKNEYYAYLSNIANAERNRGRLQSALNWLNKPLQEITDRSRSWLYAKLTQIEVYRALNWHEKAENAALELIETTDGNEQAIAYRELGLAQAERRETQKAEANLNEALQRFIEGDSPAEADITRLRIGQVRLAAQRPERLDLNQLQQALQTAAQLVSAFEDMWREKIEARLLVARLLVLIGKAYRNSGLFAEGEAALGSARAEAEAIIRLVGEDDNETYLYTASTVLGNAYAEQGQTAQAETAYRRAIQRVEDMQRNLAIMFRPGFLGDKGEALHHLIQLYQDRGAVNEAFDAIERAKSTVFWGWISAEDPRNQERVTGIQGQKQHLDALHADLFSLHRQKREGGPLPSDFSTRESELLNQIELAVQQIFTSLNGTDIAQRAGMSWKQIAQHLPAGSVLVMYYDDNRSMSAFTLAAGGTPQWHSLPSTSGNVYKLLNQWNAATRQPLMWLSTNAGRMAADTADPLAAVARFPGMDAQRMRFNDFADELGAALLAPIRDVLESAQQVIFVPYRQLHNVPFHLLRNNGSYLIEQKAVTILPTASLIVSRQRRTPQPGATIVWDDRDGHLKRSEETAQSAQQHLPNSIVIEAKAVPVSEVFENANRQILQIIAHGEFNPVFPEASRLYMGRDKNTDQDKYITLIDLMYHPLTCDLVVLTACDVGQGLIAPRTFNNHAAGDDVLGLARAFLYSGAGALLTSLWQIVDGFSIPLLEYFYTALMNGSTKPEALRTAQLALLQRYPTLHPVFWGAFQLVGDPNPLPTPAGHTQMPSRSLNRF